MKREILFRGYNRKSKKWLYGYYFVNRGVHIIAQDEIQTNPLMTWEDLSVEPETVGQYTGLKDKNGKKIFEGDILGDLKSSVIGYVKGGVRGYCYDVIYPKPRHGEKDWSLYGTVVNDYKGNVKIVGNIHDNPELLK